MQGGSGVGAAALLVLVVSRFPLVNDPRADPETTTTDQPVDGAPLSLTQVPCRLEEALSMLASRWRWHADGKVPKKQIWERDGIGRQAPLMILMVVGKGMAASSLLRCASTHPVSPCDEVAHLLAGVIVVKPSSVILQRAETEECRGESSADAESESATGPR